jgi:hypothetical protein
MGRRSTIQLVQAAQRVAPAAFSVRQYGQIIPRPPSGDT